MGIPLQNGHDQFEISDRYTDIDWYNRTKFSVVVETGTDEFEYSSIRTGDPWIIHTEKSYKPFAFKHPWITWGSSKTLEFLKAQGFKQLEFEGMSPVVTGTNETSLFYKANNCLGI